VHTMAMYAKVRRMRLRDRLSFSEIARRTSLSRNTIKEWRRAPVRSAMNTGGQPPRSLADRFREGTLDNSRAILKGEERASCPREPTGVSK
jgi:hypothetical protein